MKNILIDIRDIETGRIFEGIGGITSNGMSKLLMDYPESIQNEILDLLFKNNYGVSLQHLKCEIGTDINTSSGTEPSHMRNENDYDIIRGYGLTIAKKAKEIKPDLILDCLRWGTPLWVTDYEKKKKFYLSYMQGARDEYQLEFDYIGPDINEGAFDENWSIYLQKAMKEAGFTAKQVICDNDKGWDVAELAENNPQLKEVAKAYGVHYMQTSTLTAQNSGKSLWLSEGLAPFRHDFAEGSLDVAYKICEMYVKGKMTKYEIHPLIEGQYPTTPFTYKGIIVANHPWSGHYEISKGFYAIAHFSRFVFPGWSYVENGCGVNDNIIFNTFISPNEKNISVVIVNTSSESAVLNFKPPAKAENKIQGNWTRYITTEDVDFQSMPLDSISNIYLDAYSIITISNLPIQKLQIPESANNKNTVFPLPYHDSFTDLQKSIKTPIYLSDQGGAFEFDHVDGKQYLVQQIALHEKPLDWTYRITPNPFTLMGSTNWWNYGFSIEYKHTELVPEEDYVLLAVRVNRADKFDYIPSGVVWKIYSSGLWELIVKGNTIATGKINHKADIFNDAAIECRDLDVTLLFNNEVIYTQAITEYGAGQIAFGCGYQQTAFKNLHVYPTTTPVDILKVLDTNYEIEYNGFTKQTGAYTYMGRTFHQAVTTGASFSYTFTGRFVSLFFKKAPDAGKIIVYVDDIKTNPISLFEPSDTFGISSYCCLLDEGEHTIKCVTVDDKAVCFDYMFICK